MRPAVVPGGDAVAPRHHDVARHAERRVFFVIRATGDSASIVNAEDFKPRVFA